ncbi:MAG: hypothetical protein KatS3mg057_2708 [Herpetosiphonaceae bacterium]|nr:MAG: hypothetical protein KatS3mg057_2708 [Herpetosiphonaceae bacterium]
MRRPGATRGESIVVVSHVGPIKALLCRALGVSLTAARHMFLDSATISVIDWGAHPLVRLFNAHHHLGWEAARWMSSKEQRQQEQRIVASKRFKKSTSNRDPCPLVQRPYLVDFA